MHRLNFAFCIILFSLSNSAIADGLKCTIPDPIHSYIASDSDRIYGSFEINGFLYVDQGGFDTQAFVSDLNNPDQITTQPALSAQFNVFPTPYGEGLYSTFGGLEVWDVNAQSGFVNLGPVETIPEGDIRSAYKNALYTQVDSSLYVYDNADKLNPIFNGRVIEMTKSGSFQIHLLRDQHRAITINTESRSLAILDLSNPLNPTLLSESPLPEIYESNSTTNLQIANNYIFMHKSVDPDNIHVYSINDSGTLIFEAIINLGNGGGQIKMFGNRIWILKDSELTLKFINPNNWTAETINIIPGNRLPFFATNDTWVDVQVFTGHPNDWRVVSLFYNDGTPKSPAEYWDSPFPYDNHYLEGESLYIANHDENSIEIYELNDDEEPFLLGSYTGLSEEHRVLHVHESTLFALARQNGHRIILSLDISNPASPTLISDQLSPFEIQNFMKPTVINGTTAFYFADNTMTAYDMGDPLDPILLGSVHVDSTRNYVIDQSDFQSGDFVIARGGFTRLRMIDISDPTQMIVGSLIQDNNGFTAAAVNDNYLYTEIQRFIDFESTYADTYDVSDVLNPQRVDYTITNGIRATSLSIYDDRMLKVGQPVGSSGPNHLVIADISAPDDQTILYSQALGVGSNITLGNRRALITKNNRTHLIDLSENCTECPADLIPDNQLTLEDVQRFIALFYMHDPYADFNDDGSVDFFDISSYLRAYTEPCN